jgi:molybdenum cofactor cytidylyltransferase
MALKIEGILLAAGESRRMGYPKPLLMIGGETFLAHCAATMLEVVSRLIIVTGAHDDRVARAVPQDPRVATHHNPEWSRGQLSSLKTGLIGLTPECSAVVVQLADHPLVKAATVRGLVATYNETHMPIVIARHNQRRGHPVLFDRAVFDELMAAPDELGARAVVNADSGRVTYFEVDDPGVVMDLDTPAELISAGLRPPPSAG